MNKRLGKGIGALITSYNTEDSERYLDGAISIKDIVPNRNQPRKDFDPKSMEELINSIREKGILQPITVRELEEGKFELIAGERRFRSAQTLEMETIPAYILSVDTDVEMMEYALIENVQRQNLNPIEEAEGYALLSSKYGLSQEEIAKQVGKSRPEVANTMRLIKLPPNIRNSLKIAAGDGGISKGHARALLALKNSTQMLNLFHRVVNENLSVRQTEDLVKSLADAPNPRPVKKNIKKKDSTLSKLEGNLISHFGTKVSIQKNGKGKGRINIDFYSDEDLQRILEIISGS